MRAKEAHARELIVPQFNTLPELTSIIPQSHISLLTSQLYYLTSHLNLIYSQSIQTSAKFRPRVSNFYNSTISFTKWRNYLKSLSFKNTGIIF